MSSFGIPHSTIAFLQELSENNYRPWFNEQKDAYTDAHMQMIEFAELLISEMNKIDHLVPMSGKKSLFRIYRDVRFSKDKSPYKTYFSGRLKRATRRLRGGYYYHIEPGNSFIGGGFWRPNSGDIKRIRQEIAADDQTLRKIISTKSFKKAFGTLQGDQVKTAPQGYAKDHPAIDLLRYKQFLLMRPFTDKEVMLNSFLSEAVNTFEQMRPFFDYMSEVLTTDANGRSLFE
jgi:uncharacterized protein (TIGR02453 family)